MTHRQRLRIKGSPTCMVLNLPISLQTQNFARPGPLCEPKDLWAMWSPWHLLSSTIVIMQKHLWFRCQRMDVARLGQRAMV